MMIGSQLRSAGCTGRMSCGPVLTSTIVHRLQKTKDRCGVGCYRRDFRRPLMSGKTPSAAGNFPTAIMGRDKTTVRRCCAGPLLIIRSNTMKIFALSIAVLSSTLSISAVAQTADDLYRQACGPKEASFGVKQIQGQAQTAPEPGKALVYFIQKESGTNFTTRIGLDGAWAGVIERDSYISVSVAPGEHHACAATRDKNHPKPELVHFTAKAGEVYYYLVRGIAASTGTGGFATMMFGPVDRDEARFLIASDPQSVATPKR